MTDTVQTDSFEKIREAVKALNLAPMGAKLLLAEEPRSEEKYRGVIVIPQAHGEKSKRGRFCRVIAAGPEATTHERALVVIGTYQGTIIDFGPEVSALLVDESELMLGELPPAEEPVPSRYEGPIEPGMRFIWTPTGERVIVTRVVAIEGDGRRIFCRRQRREGADDLSEIGNDESRWREACVPEVGEDRL